MALGKARACLSCPGLGAEGKDVSRLGQAALAGTTCDCAALIPSSIFAPLSRMEAEIVQQQAPPSYGQLIAQGAIPPVEDFPTENPNDVSDLPALVPPASQPPVALPLYRSSLRLRALPTSLTLMSASSPCRTQYSATCVLCYRSCARI